MKLFILGAILAPVLIICGLAIGAQAAKIIM